MIARAYQLDLKNSLESELERALILHSASHMLELLRGIQINPETANGVTAVRGLKVTTSHLVGRNVAYLVIDEVLEESEA